ncbi:N-acetyl-gamma-glutamyl-phosphate reductase [Clostridium cellulovorans]|uniref:N-acetyl-gamma-glutamyl-phosphate reductase n=1 Tax=Clostridium cellulovorans (strain ATCC 35296 / DSM 3052 / OCM 3 / 743B) TaxID=573061 RepID=D9SLS2_CLOC7|nr:N-acetyl-gamma-glutamyl-phosphate reductase [Clostridium cellulovorans]ADL53709.1 N-acetyl-gamma-glutamyl-phosphate reductase [Clostridium cellulovorans 743B]
MINAGIIGATGYAGEQLVWILNNHKDVNIVYLTAHNYAGMSFDDVYSNFRGFINQKCIDLKEATERLDEVDVLFVALHQGGAFEIAKEAMKKGIKIIDLGPDFRIKDVNCYEEWYKIDHNAAELLDEAVYGLVELNREDIKGKALIANPGCYPTATALGLAPLVKNGLVELKSIIVDAKSGISGAGRGANIQNLYCESSESFKAYGVTTHRHTPEIEQQLSALAGDEVIISFTPHLVPMARGILSTCYAQLKKDMTTEEILDFYKEFYKDEKFVRVIDGFPETKWVKGSNLCDIGVRVDKRTNRVIVMSAIDNLIKGAAGQAVQNMNLIFGLEETEGLNFMPMFP